LKKRKNVAKLTDLEKQLSNHYIEESDEEDDAQVDI
jgi:hypothetical protein